jgi:hypothetical protein
MHSITMASLLALQCFVVLFVALHNWIPLGTLNDVKSVRAEFPSGKLLITTFINFTPVAIGLAASAFYFGRAYPGRAKQQVPPLRSPGFPVEIGGVIELHAAFLTESRTRGCW